MDGECRKTKLVDVRVPLGGGWSLRLMERPGRGLGRAELDALVAGLQGVADRCVPGGELRYGVLSGDRDRLADALLAVAYDPMREIVGFSAMTMLAVTVGGRRLPVVHAGLAMVDSRCRRHGLCALLSAAPALLAFLRNRFAPLWFTNVTQVPAVAGVFASALADVFPSPERRTGPPAAHAAVAAEVMAHHRAAFGVGDDADFDAQAFVIRNAYTGGSDDLKKSYTSCAKHRDARFNTWLRQSLDYARGDDVIQVGRMTASDWSRLVWRFAVRRARGSRQGVRIAGSEVALAPTMGVRA